MTVSAVLLLMALLIDYSRIAAFQYKLDSLAGSSVRSVLAAYDEPLYERYGLFGRGGTDAAQLAAEALDVSDARGGLSDLLPSEKDGLSRRIDLLQLELGEPSAQPALMLGEWPVLRRQIEQEMKIKGPIDLTLELIDKLRPVGGSMKQAAQEIGTLQQSEKVFDKRQSALAEMLSLGRLPQRWSGKRAATDSSRCLDAARQPRSRSRRTATARTSLGWPPMKPPKRPTKRRCWQFLRPRKACRPLRCRLRRC